VSRATSARPRPSYDEVIGGFGSESIGRGASFALIALGALVIVVASVEALGASGMADYLFFVWMTLPMILAAPLLHEHAMRPGTAMIGTVAAVSISVLEVVTFDPLSSSTAAVAIPLFPFCPCLLSPWP
jgi:integral membrane sensor domain MASE1